MRKPHISKIKTATVKCFKSIPITLALQLCPELLDATKSLDDVAIGPVKFDKPIGHIPEDEINVQRVSPSVLYATHQLNNVHVFSQSEIEPSHLNGDGPSICLQE